MKGLVIKSTGLWYDILVDETVYKGRLKGKIRLSELKTTNPLAVGDVVECESESEGHVSIKSIDVRRNYIIRKSTKLSSQAHIIASNIDLAVVVVTLKQPRTSIGFIDRFLVTTSSFNIPSLIVFNKSDIYSPTDLEEIKRVENIYKKIGHDSLLVSSKEGTNLDQLKRHIQNKRVVFSGHSGVGKSSLLNELEPSLKLDTQEVSKHTNKGLHTTTFSTMHFINKKTAVIDTPGIKEIGLYQIEREELGHYFPEIASLLGNCKFHNCTHQHEPGCEIKTAVENGEIDPIRYENYLNILESEDMNKK